MNLNFSRKPLPLFSQTHQNLSRVLTSSLFSTKAPTQYSPVSSIPDALYYKIVSVRDPKISVLPVLDQWVDEGNSIHRDQLVSLARIMKENKRFNHALEIPHWMTDRRYFKLTPPDAAVRLAMIRRVHGVEQAENYFDKLSCKLKTGYAYSAILHGYVRERSVQKQKHLCRK